LLKIDRLDLLGIFLIILGVVVLTTSFMDNLVMMIMWPLLFGSSEGKAVLFFVGMGSLLILNSLIRSKISFFNTIYSRLKEFSPDGRKYLKIFLILVILTYFAGIIIEIFLRLKYGVSPLTIFVSLNPSPTSTSPTHSHVFKSVLGYLIEVVGLHVPNHVHTGASLIQQVMPWAFLIIFTLPAAYITGLFSLNNQRDLYKIIMAFSITLTLVGMLDGGIFSPPGMIGLAGILGIYAIKSPFKMRQLLVPAILIVLLIVSGVALEILGSNSAYHELTIINPHQPIDLQGYDVISIQNQNDRTIIRIKANRSDKKTLEDLFVSLEGKADGFFMTWNFASYL